VGDEARAGFRGGRDGAVGSAAHDANNGYDSRWFVSGFARQHIVGGFGAYRGNARVSSASSSSFAGTIGGGATFDFRNSSSSITV